MRVVAESCDQVLDATDPVAVRIEYRSVQERGEMEDFSHVMPLRFPQGYPQPANSPRESFGDMWANGARTKNDSAQRGFEARQYFSDEGDVIVADARVRHEASPSWTDGAAIDAKDREFFDQLSRLRVVEGHDVRATRRGVVSASGNVVAKSRPDSRASVIVGQSIDHLIERDQSGAARNPA